MQMDIGKAVPDRLQGACVFFVRMLTGGLCLHAQGRKQAEHIGFPEKEPGERGIFGKAQRLKKSRISNGMTGICKKGGKPVQKTGTLSFCIQVKLDIVGAVDADAFCSHAGGTKEDRVRYGRQGQIVRYDVAAVGIDDIFYFIMPDSALTVGIAAVLQHGASGIVPGAKYRRKVVWIKIFHGNPIWQSRFNTACRRICFG